MIASSFFPESALAHKYCVGKGLEIGGSAHNPFGLNTLNVDFTASMETIFKKEETQICGQSLQVDIVARGDNIPLPDESRDFIVSSHVLEHFSNPIKALLEWDRLIKPGGIIFMIVPHKERMFDKDKDRTTLQHLVEDFINNAPELPEDPQGHYHYWITEDTIALVNWMIEHLQLNWQLADFADIDDKVGNGFTIVIRKTGRTDFRIDRQSLLKDLNAPSDSYLSYLKNAHGLVSRKRKSMPPKERFKHIYISLRRKGGRILTKLGLRKPPRK